MCWKCDAIAVTCPSVTLPDWMYGPLEAFPLEGEASDDLPPLDLQTTAFSPSDFGHPEEHNKGARRAPARLYVTDKTGTSGPKPKVPGSIGLSGVFCL